MINDLYDTFSDSAHGMERSAIREILKLTQKPGVISFGGGLPSPESFPVNELNQIIHELLNEDGPNALQYGATEGVPELRKLLLDRYRNEGLNLELENITITTSSQQGLYILGKIFLNKGDHIICGLPSYLGAISAFSTFGAKLHGIPLDDKGMKHDRLEEKIKDLKGQGQKPKIIYLVPDFQNPAGITIPESRRQNILDVAKKHNILIVEDCPYREIRFEGEQQKSMYHLDSTGQVIKLGSFSKTFAPGFRLGWAVAHQDIIEKMVIAKQSIDLCTPTFTQKIVVRYIKKGFFDANLKKIIDEYRSKRNNMLYALQKYMPNKVSWTKPQGGMFVFLNLPDHMDSEQLFYKAIEKDVAFVMGNVFFCDGSGKNTLRINFSFMPEDKAREGIKRLADVINKNI